TVARSPASPPCPLRVFFFSSRRRHTRSKRDWSSDVCSSDLGFRGGAITFDVFSARRGGGRPPLAWGRGERNPGNTVGTGKPWSRSEERRVGKEGRAVRGGERGGERRQGRAG